MMTSASVSWWPYVAMTLFWVVVCGYFFRRAWKARARFWRSADKAPMWPEHRSPQGMQDTQAGRI